MCDIENCGQMLQDIDHLYKHYKPIDEYYKYNKSIHPTMRCFYGGCKYLITKYDEGTDLSKYYSNSKKNQKIGKTKKSFTKNNIQIQRINIQRIIISISKKRFEKF
jgi:hypothetical protein